MGVDKVGIGKVGVDKVGVDHMGRHRIIIYVALVWHAHVHTCSIYIYLVGA